MPKGDLGRIGLAIARSNPSIVYALVEAEKSALLRSDDGGRKWTAVNTEYNVASRPFYYADIRVDPQDPNRVYNVCVADLALDRRRQELQDARAVREDPSRLSRDVDRPERPDAHLRRQRRRRRGEPGPRHELALRRHAAARRSTTTSPSTTRRRTTSTAACRTTARGRGRTRPGRPAASATGTGRKWASATASRTVPIPTDSMIGYAMSQEGYLVRWNLRTGERKDIRPSAPQGRGAALQLERRHRHRSVRSRTASTSAASTCTSRRTAATPGRRSVPTSPPIARNGSTRTAAAASRPTSPARRTSPPSSTIAPSPLERGVIWVGTDDGRVHVTRDGGANWTSVEGNIKGVPANTWVPEIKASRHAAGTAFIVLDDHRRSNWRRTSTAPPTTASRGRRWSTKDLQGYALSIEQDPVDPDLLFLGTEFGLWVSNDAGKSWMKWKHGFPTVSVMGLAVHPRDHDLVIGTHGRAAYVLDDIRPLRTMSKETLAKPLHFFEVPDAQTYTTRQKEGSRFVGDAEFRARERAVRRAAHLLAEPPRPSASDRGEGARAQGEGARRRAEDARRREAGVPPAVAEDMPKEPEAQQKPAEPPKKDDEAKTTRPRGRHRSRRRHRQVIRRFKGPANLGVNRTSWDLKRDAFKRPPTGEPPRRRPRGRGTEVPPGHVHDHDEIPRPGSEADRARPRPIRARATPPSSASRNTTPSCAPAACRRPPPPPSSASRKPAPTSTPSPPS